MIPWKPSPLAQDHFLEKLINKEKEMDYKLNMSWDYMNPYVIHQPILILNIDHVNSARMNYNHPSTTIFGLSPIHDVLDVLDC